MNAFRVSARQCALVVSLHFGDRRVETLTSSATNCHRASPLLASSATGRSGSVAISVYKWFHSSEGRNSGEFPYGERNAHAFCYGLPPRRGGPQGIAALGEWRHGSAFICVHLRFPSPDRCELVKICGQLE